MAHGKGSTNPGAAPIFQAPIIPLCAVCPHQPISNAWLFKPSQAPLFFYEQIRPSQSLCTVCFRIFSALSPSWPLSAPPGLAVTEDGTNRRGAGRTLAAITRPQARATRQRRLQSMAMPPVEWLGLAICQLWTCQSIMHRVVAWLEPE